MSFRALHIPGSPFVMPNPWDAGSARLLASQGFAALASTSAGAAYAKGQTDGSLSLDEMLHAAKTLADATGLPVNADLEHGGGNRPSDAADAIAKAGQLSLDGASIEDLDTQGHIFPFDHALARIDAAIAAKADHNLVLTARTEIMLSGAPNFDEVLRRIAAFAQAGADVVFAPGLKDAAQIQAVVAAAKDVPVNVLIGNNALGLSLKDLADLGVARISTGSALTRAAYGAMLHMTDTLLQTGTFQYPETTVSFSDIQNALSTNDS